MHVVDGDGHVLEKDVELFEYLPANYRAATELLDNPLFPTVDGFNRTAIRIADGKGRTTPTVVVDDWVSYLDDMHIAATVLFPSRGLGFGLVRDPTWAEVLARAYNDWLYDRYLRHDPVRLKGVALIPVQNPAAAASELKRAVTELGMVAAALPANGLSEAYGHRNFWPIYEAAQEHGCALAVHGGSINGLGLERLERLIEARTLSHGFGVMIQATSMIFEGVFDLFPGVRVCFCEAGMGWAPFLAENMDLHYKNRTRQAPDLKVMPSEHFRNGHVFVQTELGERSLAHGIKYFGESTFFSASDFPHEPREEYPEALHEFAQRDDVSDSARHKILWDNPIKLYRLNEAELKAHPSWANAA
jgi:uncharacterized protein